MTDATDDRPADVAPPRALPATARRTARSVIVADAAAGVVVRTGGVLVIVAVVGILAFLVATVLPLFRPAEVTPTPVTGRVPVEGEVRLLAIDEYRLVAAAVGEAPEIVWFRPDTAEVIGRAPIPGLEGARVSAAARSVRTRDVVVGTTDGRLGFFGLAFASDYVIGAEGESLRGTFAPGEVRAVGGAVVARRTGGTLLRVRGEATPRGSLRLPPEGGAVVAASYASHDGDGAAAAVTADGSAHVVREAAGAGDVAGDARFRLDAVAPGGPAVPANLFATVVDEERRTAWFAARDGALQRVDLTSRPAVRRETRLTLPGDGSRLTALGTVIGDRSLVLADDRGRVTVWSVVPLDPAQVGGADDPGDRARIARLHAFEAFASPARLVAACPTRRTFYLGHADGSVTAAYPTNQRVLAAASAFGGAVAAVAVGPKDDGILVVGPGGVYRALSVNAPHPETNTRALFGEVHYEGYAEPQFKYESSAGSDEAEPKLSLRPLLFGAIKATVYALLFALPLALLGALYTSQFMHPRVRAVVKPGVEVMASLPSVVLGFVAARLLAPSMESIVPGVFAAIGAILLVGFAAGGVWYLVPSHVRNVVGSGTRLAIAAALMAGTAWACTALSPWIEERLFSVRLGDGRVVADFRRWLYEPKGAADGLGLLRTALFVLGSGVGLFALPRRVPLPALSRLPRVAAVGARTVAYFVLPGVLLAAAAPLVRDVVFGGDFRWFLVGSDDPGQGTRYEQSNSLVVGIAMGFAVIPIIYTIAEDALSAIPDSLRSAALGCGASPWQAAMRVVVPAAVPGMFSATMIGFGRAVGETMIVLMAAGGTPIMDWSVFNGFRTLSVNIATELPEAPVGGTLYRVLFLAGLLLFALTFVLNTVAEVVRLRFRKKFKGL